MKNHLKFTALIPFFLASTLWAFPSPQGRINDFAGVLNQDSRGQIQAVVDEVESKTAAEIAVVTVPSLEGMTVEEYANGLFKQWGIGKKGKDNGLLVLICPSAHKMRIEVGYGLEPVISDGLAGMVIRKVFTPAFKTGDYPGGTVAGTKLLAHFIEGSENAGAWSAKNKSDSIGAQLFLCCFLSVFVFFGFWIIGGSLADKTISPIFFGGVFGALPLFMAWKGFKNSQFSIWLLAFLLLEALVFMICGYFFVAKKQRSKKASKKGWVWVGASPAVYGRSGRNSGGNGGDGGSGGGGGFGGGSSGGGGASGGW